MIAHNEVGESDPSGLITIKAASVPSTPLIFTTVHQSTTSITISWTEPDNGGTAITDYEVDWDQGSNVNAWTALVTTTSGTTQHIVSGLTDAGATYSFKVRAINAIGESSDSLAYSVIAATTPDPPNTFVRDNAQTTKTQVAFNWQAPPSDGGSPVIDYTIEFDNGLTSPYILAADGVANTNHIETGLSVGNKYTFKVKARNAVGFSDWSDYFEIFAATVPAAVAAPTAQLSGDEESVVIDWNAPGDDGGMQVQGYRLYIKTHDGNFVQDTTNCDAETDNIIISNSACSVPVDGLRGAPWSLAEGAQVTVKVVSFNGIGNSVESPEGVGDAIPALGTVPGAPTNLQRVDGLTDHTQVTISWSAPGDDGGETISGYRVYYDQGINSFVVAAESVTLTQYTKTGLSAGLSYKFKVQACNSVGCGADSVEFTIRAATVPSQPDAPTTTLSGNSVVIAWTVPSNQGDQGAEVITVTGYTLEIQKDDSLWEIDSGDCVLSTSTTCSIPITVLRAAPYLLDDNDSVSARVTATNIIGDSLVSSIGNGASLPIATVPGVPTGLARNAATSQTQASLTWTAPADDGTAAVIDYKVEYDQGNGSWTTTPGSASVSGTGYTQTGLASGVNFKFRVYAQNSVGYSSPSDELTILTATIPSQPNAPTTTINGSNVDIDWTAPSDLGGIAL